MVTKMQMGVWVYECPRLIFLTLKCLFRAAHECLRQADAQVLHDTTPTVDLLIACLSANGVGNIDEAARVNERDHEDEAVGERASQTRADNV